MKNAPAPAQAPARPCDYCMIHAATGYVSAYDAHLCPCCYADNHGPTLGENIDACAPFAEPAPPVTFAQQDAEHTIYLPELAKVCTCQPVYVLGRQHHRDSCAFALPLALERVATEKDAAEILFSAIQSRFPVEWTWKEEEAADRREFAMTLGGTLELTEARTIDSRGLFPLNATHYTLTLDRDAAAELIERTSDKLCAHRLGVHITGLIGNDGLPKSAEFHYFDSQAEEWIERHMNQQEETSIIEFARTAFDH